MQKRFALCMACLDTRALDVNQLVDQTFMISENQLYTVSHHAPKTKQLKCNACGTLKSAAWSFNEARVDSPLALAKGIRGHLERLRHKSWSFGHASLMELADWLERENTFIAHNGRDYWVDAGVLYFFGLGDGFIIHLNGEEITLEGLVELFLK